LLDEMFIIIGLTKLKYLPIIQIYKQQ